MYKFFQHNIKAYAEHMDRLNNMTDQEFIAYISNRHINKKVEVKHEDGEGLEKLVPDIYEKGRYTWIPF